VTVEQAIHQCWASSATLAALVPAERVSTGRSIGAAVPYVTLLRERTRTALRTNAGNTIEEITLRINLWHDDHDAGRAAAEQIRAAFDHASFDLADGSRVISMRRVSESAFQHADGLWQFSLRFLLPVRLACD